MPVKIIYSIRSLVPHGHSEKTAALRADTLTNTRIYRMDINTRKNENFLYVHPETPMPPAARGSF